MAVMLPELNSKNAYIFRITHLDNLPWILANGLHCKNSQTKDPKFVTIGNPDLIDRRSGHSVNCRHGGKLSDYIPFYFTPLSPMFLNIKTGYRGLRQRDNAEIVIIVSSVHKLKKQDIGFVFSDRHAVLRAAQFFYEPDSLDKLDWGILQRHRV